MKIKDCDGFIKFAPKGNDRDQVRAISAKIGDIGWLYKNFKTRFINLCHN